MISLNLMDFRCFVIIGTVLLDRIICEQPESEIVQATPTGNASVPVENSLIPEDAIINGSLTRPGEFPFVTSVQLLGKPGVHMCGGAIITWSHIITAAHCVQPFLKAEAGGKIPLMVAVGVYDVMNTPSFKTIPVKKIIVHEDFDPEDELLNNDIALIVLEKPIPESLRKEAQRIKLPIKPDPEEGTNLWTVGWGVTEFGKLSPLLLKTRLPTLSNEECGERLGREIASTQICFDNKRSGICQGDSGGAIFRRDRSGYVLVGITSFGPKTCKAGTANVFTRVSMYYDWIKDHVKAAS